MSVLSWRLNAILYYQYFCVDPIYKPHVPYPSTELAHFRNRISVAGFNLILKAGIEINGKKHNKPTVLVDTLSIEKNITYDAKLSTKNNSHGS